MGIIITKVEQNYVFGKIPVDERTKQTFGRLHVGASVAPEETLRSLGSKMNVNHPNRYVVGVEIRSNHLKSIKNRCSSSAANALRFVKKIYVRKLMLKI